MQADPIDHLGPGDPETQTMAAGIDQGRQGGQVHHPIHLLQPPLRHGRQDWARDGSVPGQPIDEHGEPGADIDVTTAKVWDDGGSKADQGES